MINRAFLKRVAMATFALPIIAVWVPASAQTTSANETAVGQTEIGQGILRYRFVREPGTTPGGYPLPLSGKVMATSPVIVKQKGVELRKYPEIYYPGQEQLASDEMRIAACGSGNPPLRRRQGSTCWLVELGNGDNFVFDIGGGTVPNLWSLGVPPSRLDKLFLTHLHLDHVGGILSRGRARGAVRDERSFGSGEGLRGGAKTVVSSICYKPTFLAERPECAGKQTFTRRSASVGFVPRSDIAQRYVSC